MDSHHQSHATVQPESSMKTKIAQHDRINLNFRNEGHFKQGFI